MTLVGQDPPEDKDQTLKFMMEKHSKDSGLFSFTRNTFNYYQISEL